MGLFDKLRNRNKEKNNENSNPDLFSNEINNDFFVSDVQPVDKNKNFSYLNELIHNGTKEVNLDSDIILDSNESMIYKVGIFVDVDDLVINGNGFAIDGNNLARIFFIRGNNVTLKNIRFVNGFSSLQGAAIYNKESTNLQIVNCSFYNNNSKNDGAAIYNSGELLINDSTFENNHSSDNGGSISNNKILNIHDCNFNNNAADGPGGAIFNGRNSSLNIRSCRFTNNKSGNGGAIFNSEESILNICSATDFNNNESVAGGAIINTGSLNIKNADFNNNIANDGGAIYNNDKMILNEIKFNGNISNKDGGAVYTTPGSITSISNSSLINNNGIEGGAIYSCSNEFKLIDSIISKHDNFNSVIFNKKSLDIMGTKFEENNSINIINSIENSFLYVSDSEFNRNNIVDAVVYNNAKECNVYKTKFNDNKTTEKACNTIYNLSNLNLREIQFINNHYSIFNKGYILIKDESEFNIEEMITGEGTIEVLSSQSESSNNSFNCLDRLIHENNNKNIILNENFTLQTIEQDFYEGGIELDIDNLEIDGNGKTIDANKKSRIFNITAKNVTLKNIIFKNGLSNTIFDPHSIGGGAIRIVKGSSLNLENCQFIDNYSNGNGGAIINNGNLNSKNSSFNNNQSENYGGAIFNNHDVAIHEDTFEKNRSKIGGALYNKGNLIIVDEIYLIDNISDFKEDIYNTNLIQTDAISRNIVESICNFGELNKNAEEYVSFSDLNKLIDENNEITLKQDIIFDFVEDNQFKNGILIEKDLIIDGNNCSIDGNGSSALFDIAKGISVILKNLTVKNTYSACKSIIENNGNLRLENCRFINNRICMGKHLIVNNFEKLIIINSSISNNYSKDQSLIYNPSNSVYKTLEIINSKFINNLSESSGSVLFNHGNSLIKESCFKNNSTTRDGGAINNDGSLFIEYSKFIKNNSINGGAIKNHQGVLQIDDSEFTGNYSTSGGAIHNMSSRFHLENSKFTNNNSNDGGAINSRGGIFDCKSVEFIENSAEVGGAITCGEDLNLVNTHFSGNVSRESGGVIRIRELVDLNKIKMELINNGCTFGNNIPKDIN